MLRLAPLLVLLCACAGKTIPDTEIPDTPDTRAIYDLVERYHQAMEDHEAAAVLSLASESYFEDFGTRDATDDRGFEQLKRELADSLSRVKRLDLTIHVKDIVVEGEQAHVDFVYTQRALFATPSGDEWREQTDDSRMRLRREGGGWKVVAGL